MSRRDEATLDLFAAPAAMVAPTTTPATAAIAAMPLDRRGTSRPGRGVPTPEELYHAGVLREVDVHFARRTARLAGDADPHVLLGLAVASRAPGAGHVCAELDAPERLVRLEDDAVAPAWPDAAVWTAALAGSGVAAAPDAWARACGEGLGCPLVLDGTRLYLARYWGYQQRLTEALRARAAGPRADVDAGALRDGLARLFPGVGPADVVDLQRVAAAAAALRGLAVVTGGPGTGKTTTVLKVLALLVEQALAIGAPVPRIVLAAPTGKAAARLGESIAAGLARLAEEGLALPDAVARAIPRAATTVHRLLRRDMRRPTRFVHCAERPLPADVVVVDEGSMVDLALMTRLVDAVPHDARLVLLGDRDQLASVEAGSILADVCGDAGNRFSTAFATRLADACGAPALGGPAHCAPAGAPAIVDCVVRLTVSHRFRADGGIGALAAAINDGRADDALAVLRAGVGDDRRGRVRFHELEAPRPPLALLRDLALPAYRRVVQAQGAKEALAALDAFRVLAAHRAGRFGVAGLNDALLDALVGERTLPRDARTAPWYHGQPVLVTENDPQLELANGDVGVVLRDGDAAGTLRAWFATGDGRQRAVAPARLPAHETVFAMTVHKSQGSEFQDVLVVLPPRPSAVLTRELLYTAVSRARTQVTVVGSEATIRAAIDARVQRASGLREALWS